MADLKALADAVIKGNQTESVRLTKEALAEKMSPKRILEEGGESRPRRCDPLHALQLRAHSQIASCHASNGS